MRWKMQEVSNGDQDVTDMAEMQYSIIIPAWNEEARIVSTLREVSAWIRDAGLSTSQCEVIVVCDGCSDGTEAVALHRAEEMACLKVISYPQNRGKGYAVRTGVMASEGRLVLFMDADGSTPVGELNKLACHLEKECADIVMGSRRVAGSCVFPRQPLQRRLLGYVFSGFTGAVLRVPYLDTQCGFKLMRGTVARRLFEEMECDGFAFDLELLVRALGHGFRVREYGVTWHDVSESKVSPLRDGLRMVLAVLRLRFRFRELTAWVRPEQLVPTTAGKG